VGVGRAASRRCHEDQGHRSRSPKIAQEQVSNPGSARNRDDEPDPPRISDRLACGHAIDAAPCSPVRAGENGTWGSLSSGSVDMVLLDEAVCTDHGQFDLVRPRTVDSTATRTGTSVVRSTALSARLIRVASTSTWRVGQAVPTSAPHSRTLLRPSSGSSTTMSSRCRSAFPQTLTPDG